MRVPLLVVLPIVLAGCAEPEAPPRTLPILQMGVEVEGNTTFALGEVLGSKEGDLVEGFRFDDDAKTLLARIPEDATHLFLLKQTDAAPALVADATRATATARGSQRPAILEFEPEGETFEVRVVQPAECGAVVNNRDSVTNGTGPFAIPPLRALPPGNREFVVFVLTGQGAPDCALVRVEAENLGRWTILDPDED